MKPVTIILTPNNSQDEIHFLTKGKNVVKISKFPINLNELTSKIECIVVEGVEDSIKLNNLILTKKLTFRPLNQRSLIEIERPELIIVSKTLKKEEFLELPAIKFVEA